MKNRLKLHKRISLGLALSVLLAALPVPVHAAAGYNQLHSSSLDLNNQMTMHQGTYYNTANSSKTSENYLVYKPGSAITPFVSSGNDVYGAAGISRIYEIEEGAGRNIVAASNGDYFTMATGVSLGVLVKDGLVRTGEHSSHESIGFKRNGTAVIGRMGLAVRVYNGQTGGGFNGTGFNKMLTKDNGVMLYTGDFGPTNEVSIPAHNVMIQIVSGTAVPGGTVEGIVRGSADSLGKTALFEDEMLLSIALNTPYTSALNTLKEMKAEDKVTVEFSVSPGWEDVHQALGAERRLITNGVVSTFQDATRAPRTAFGIRSDGSCVLYTVDGRQSGYSMGMTYAELAARLKELGCVDAVNLDGGDSTMMFATLPGYEDRSQVNRHSGSSLRRCGNYILFENNATPKKTVSHLHLYPHDLLILAGSTVDLDVRATDANYYYVAPPSTGVSFSLDSKNLGTVSNAGRFTAGSKAMTGSITAKSGSASGRTQVSVVAAPDSVALFLKETGAEAPKQLSVPAGEATAFTAKAVYNMIELIADSEAFTWTVDGPIGSVDQNGVFTASTTASGTGTLTVKAGEKSASIELKVVTEGRALETFEQPDALIFDLGKHGDLTASLTSDPAFVHNGYRSLSLSYSYDVRAVEPEDEGDEESEEEGTGNGGASDRSLSLPMRAAFTGKNPTMLAAWVYGNGRNEVLQVDVRAGGETKTLALSGLKTAGWTLAHVQLPAGVTHLEGLSILPVSQSRGSGTIYIDQIMAGFGHYLDETPPVIEARVEDSLLTGTIADDLDSDLDASSISVTYDGQAIAFTYDKSAKKLSASLPQGDGYEHRILVRATDKSGNIGRLGLFHPTESPDADFVREAVFSDMKASHWGTAYAEYLYRHDIITGRLSGKNRVYDPDNTMTRQEFAAVIIRGLDVDTEAYSGQKLSFADGSKIQSWAVDSVKAAVALGYMAGKADSGSNKVYFDPTGPISRQEVMTVIGRIQEKGYAGATLDFKDAKDVASWALPYASALVGQGVISGYNGRLDPKGNVTRAQIAKIIAELN